MGWFAGRRDAGRMQPPSSAASRASDRGAPQTTPSRRHTPQGRARRPWAPLRRWEAMAPDPAGVALRPPPAGPPKGCAGARGGTGELGAGDSSDVGGWAACSRRVSARGAGGASPRAPRPLGSSPGALPRRRPVSPPNFSPERRARSLPLARPRILAPVALVRPVKRYCCHSACSRMQAGPAAVSRDAELERASGEYGK